MDYSKAVTLVSPKEGRQIEARRNAAGYLVPRPTHKDIWARHLYKRGWYTPRDILIRKFTSMLNLESPYEADKNGLQDGGYLLQSGYDEYSVETFPFDVMSYAQSQLASKYPYANVRPSSPDQTDSQLEQFEM